MPGWIRTERVKLAVTVTVRTPTPFSRIRTTTKTVTQPYPNSRISSKRIMKNTAYVEECREIGQYHFNPSNHSLHLAFSCVRSMTWTDYFFRRVRFLGYLLPPIFLFPLIPFLLHRGYISHSFRSLSVHVFGTSFFTRSIRLTPFFDSTFSCVQHSPRRLGYSCLVSPSTLTDR